MAKEWAKGWRFDFIVQPQVAGKNMPVENPSSLWSEKDSRFVSAVKIEIPPQPVPDGGSFREDVRSIPRIRCRSRPGRDEPRAMNFFRSMRAASAGGTIA
jgi:hypothetical protein